MMFSTKCTYELVLVECGGRVASTQDVSSSGIDADFLGVSKCHKIT